jgi:hypothetical protein
VNIGNQARRKSTLGEIEAPRYEFITSLYVALRPGCFNTGETTTVTQGPGGAVGHRASTGSFEEKNLLPLPGIELPIPRKYNP